MYASRPLALLMLLGTLGCGPSAEERAEQERYEQAQKEKDKKFEDGFSSIVRLREYMAKVATAWPEATTPPTTDGCGAPADVVLMEFESVARYGKDPRAVVPGSALSDRSSLPIPLSKGLELQRRRAEAEARKAAEKVPALAEDDWLRFRGDALRELEPLTTELQQMAAAPRTAVFRAYKLVPPKVAGDDSFAPGFYSGAVVIFDNQSGAALCAAPIEATNRASVSEVRMDGVPLGDAVMGDLIGQAYQAAVATVATLAPGSRIVPLAR